MWQIKEIKALIAKNPKVVITTHRNPDGDALGSSLGLMHYLRKKGLNARVVTPTDFGDFLRWMPGNDEIINYEANTASAKAVFEEAEVVFCLDFNDPARTENLQSLIDGVKVPRVLIDHHLNPNGFHDYALWESSAAATAELVFDLITEFGDEDLIDQDIASCIYAGIVTDSGSFRFASTSAKLHRMSALLIEKGIDHVSIHEKIYDSFTENNLRYFGYCFNNRLKVFSDYRTAIIEVVNKDLEAFGITKDQTDGLVNFALSIQDVVFAAVIKENSQFTKISFRSKGRFPANEFAQEFFEGGGHFNAAGGKCDKSIFETTEIFKEKLEKYKDLLLSS